MAIDYTGNVYTAEEILRMRERESREDQIRLTLAQMISSAGIDNVVWILRKIAVRESETGPLLEEEPTVERDKLIAKYAILADKLLDAEEIMADIEIREYD